jgi:hypothetical protein
MSGISLQIQALLNLTAMQSSRSFTVSSPRFPLNKCGIYLKIKI